MNSGYLKFLPHNFAAAARPTGERLPQEPLYNNYRNNSHAATRAILLITILGIAFSACSKHNDVTIDRSPAVVVGTIADASIKEASGLARSTRRDNLLWVINDGGSAPILHAMGTDGSSYAQIEVNGARNIDWEDLASFHFDGKSWLLIADIGDNEARRKQCDLYIVEEPVVKEGQVSTITPAWQISFTYPDGPRDAEAVAVDIENERILLLSKRTIPAILYELPLRSTAAESLSAAHRIGAITSIPQPTQLDLERAAPENDWHWQPTGMDISERGDSIVILTYRATYYFLRQPDQSWFEALQSTPNVLSLGSHQAAEAISFAAGDQSVFVTVEQRHAPLLRFSLD